ncbi:bifunctional aminoglycoside phosphotransferase/ATP-binding protein [Limobrevibacterium gyesilva]|uniref:AAA family ATPase n=1 Tax=Limobrevibacterium gyesilva TaxID=2991712 RepID=A0AA41YNW5_9PROT|nr:AAA family ATPase [Limobrevibacterium gyesilva]MCW3475976.1 AAA family ATPase [Limobrevibacterium gyesilva]
MAIPAGQAATAALLQGLAGRPPIETHISAVFVGDDMVWKLRKAVRLAFLDFIPLAERHRTALRELELNAPHAPGLYRDVVAVVRRADGTVALGCDGEVLDWVVRMARVPEGDFLDEVARRGGLTPALLDALGDAVAAAHARLAPVDKDEAAALRGVAEGNARSALQAGLDPVRTRRWLDGALAQVQARAGWLRARSRAGFVRRAHGDLHLGNICLWHGRPVPFDALEFDEDLATIDLGYDLAFLLMDLDLREGRAAANRVLNRYVARTGDWDMVAGLPLFLSLRAMVRAHVEARNGRAPVAERYLRQALDYLRPAPPVVVAVGGLQGTGKSTLARALAPLLGPAPGALVLRSDEIRKRQHAAAPEDRLPPAAYTPEASRAVFAEMARAVGDVAAHGHAAIADATFIDPVHREAVARAAGAAPFLGVWLQAPLAVLEARVAGRTGDASDADLAVLRQAAAADPGPGSWRAVDATDGEAARQAVLDAAGRTARPRNTGSGGRV